MGNPRGRRPFLESARRRRNQGNGVANPRIIRLTAATVAAEPDAHQSSYRTRATALGVAAWTLDKPPAISDVFGKTEAAGQRGIGKEGDLVDFATAQGEHHHAPGLRA